MLKSNLLSTSLPPLTTHYPWEISTACLTTQPIMAKTCNSIIKIILLIIIISCTILCKVISFENYTHTHCGFFDDTIQHPYCGLFGHTIQHSFHSYKDHRNKEFNKEHIKMQKIEHIVNWGTWSSFSLLNLLHTCTTIGVSNIFVVPTSINDYFMCISNISCIHEHKQQIIKHHFQTQFWHTGATLKPWWSWYVPLLKVYLVGGKKQKDKKEGKENEE